MNRAAAYTLNQLRAQITLRLKTEHANAQESLWHRNKEWAPIFLSPSLSLLFFFSHAHRYPFYFHLLPLSNVTLPTARSPRLPCAPVRVFEEQPPFISSLIVPLILLHVFIAPFVKLEAPANKPVTIQ